MIFTQTTPRVEQSNKQGSRPLAAAGGSAHARACRIGTGGFPRAYYAVGRAAGLERAGDRQQARGGGE